MGVIDKHTSKYLLAARTEFWTLLVGKSVIYETHFLVMIRTAQLQLLCSYNKLFHNLDWA